MSMDKIKSGVGAETGIETGQLSMFPELMVGDVKADAIKESESPKEPPKETPKETPKKSRIVIEFDDKGIDFDSKFENWDRNLEVPRLSILAHYLNDIVTARFLQGRIEQIVFAILSKGLQKPEQKLVVPGGVPNLQVLRGNKST